VFSLSQHFMGSADLLRYPMTAAPRPPQPASAGFCCWAWRFSAGRRADFSTT